MRKEDIQAETEKEAEETQRAKNEDCGERAPGN